MSDNNHALLNYYKLVSHYSKIGWLNLPNMDDYKFGLKLED